MLKYPAFMMTLIGFGFLLGVISGTIGLEVFGW
jgi:hypothetical protein